MAESCTYDAPLGKLLLASDQGSLIGLWFEDAKYCAEGLNLERVEGKNEVLEMTQEWLNLYFSGIKPDFIPPVRLKGSPFQLKVWSILQKIPWGMTITYGEIAKIIAEKSGISRMSAQAVGGAVGKNPISIIIPCHRVIGKNGKLTGYAAGVDKKRELLRLEGFGCAETSNGNLNLLN